MRQEDYRSCMSKKMKGLKGISKEQRRLEFCVSAKECSKGTSREEAERICNISMSQPREPKARRGHRVTHQGGMRLVLLTTTDCKPCSAAKQYLQDKIDKGLIQELNIQKSDEAADLATKYGFKSVPKLLVLDEEGKPFSELQITDTEQTL